MKMKTKEICIQGLMIALVTVGTMFFQIPVSATQGYIHLGDSMILLTSIFFGWRYGMIAGGVGSALADLLSGYAHWAPFTLIIKGLMGLVIGKVADYADSKQSFFSGRNILAAVLGLLWMIIGYFFGGAILKGSLAVAATSIPENMVQAAGGYIVFAVVGFALHKANIKKYLSVK